MLRACETCGRLYVRKCPCDHGEFQIRDYSAKNNPKRPNAFYLGFELEVHFTTREKVFSFYTHDSSLSGDGVEIKTYRTPQYLHKLIEDVYCLVELGYRVEEDCGLHLHLTRTNSKAEKDLITFAEIEQDRLFDLMPEHRRNNRFVQRIENIYDHYCWINVRSRTIEIRLHYGTMNPYKIYAWALFWYNVHLIANRGELDGKHWYNIVDLTGNRYVTEHFDNLSKGLYYDRFDANMMHYNQ